MTYPESAADLIGTCPLEERDNFLHALGFDFLRSIIENNPRIPFIKNFFEILPYPIRLDSLYELGLPFFRKLFMEQPNNLDDILCNLITSDKFTLLKWLDGDILRQATKNHPKGMISWFRKISVHFTEEKTKEILILLGKDFLESQIKTSKDIEFLSKFIRVRDTSSISTTYFGLFNKPHIKTPSFVLEEALFGSELPSFPQPLSNPYGHGPKNHFVCGNGFKDWIKLMDTWNDDEIQNQDQYQWFAAYHHSVLAGLILIRYVDGDYGLMLGAQKGCEERLSKAFREKHMSAEEKYLQHFKEWKLNPPFYISKGSLHEIRTQLLDISDVMSKLEGDYPANQFILNISTQLDHIKTPPSGFSL